MVDWRWVVHWKEGHRTPYGYHPCLVSGPWDPEKPYAHGYLILPIGFCSEEECQQFIDDHLSRS